ncbi:MULTISPECIES: hypothetical protein [Streptomyces]|uniref:hypothetical protein n=1 Tax=Streptomyces TaxID=1883 RepID=UPI001111A776|nr:MULTISPECIES: hypothetical protein [Streptomyces]NJP75203.1 hypothetical protein [Streptomyces sp. C1-2]
MAGDTNPDRRKITDSDLARLLKQGLEDLANDPNASQLHERVQQRQNVEEDREHRERSNKSAAFGFLIGVALLVIFIVASIVTFRP